MIQLPIDHQDFLRLLTSHGVEYLVIGGIATVFHGYPRFTADLDVWVARERGNIEKLVEALRAFGFSRKTLVLDQFLQPDQVFRMGVDPLRIELFTGIPGVTFSDCFPRRVTVELDGLPVNFISLADHKVNKQAAGRLKDLADLEKLP